MELHVAPACLRSLNKHSRLVLEIGLLRQNRLGASELS